MSEPRVPDRPTGDQRRADEHLSLDALAECLAVPSRPSSTVRRHLEGCSGCAARLAELSEAEPAVSAALRSLPALPLPDDVAARLDSALRSLGADLGTPEAPAGATVTTLPSRANINLRSPTRWLTAAAAALILVVGGGLGIAQLTGSDSRPTTTSDTAAGSASPGFIRNDTGADYTDRAALVSAIPSLLAGTAGPASAALSAPAPAVPGKAQAKDALPPATGGEATTQLNSRATGDPLARLRTEAGLADCLLALLPPDKPEVQPLALDYGSYSGKPALVVLLPAATSGKVDVFVVGAGCSRANDSTLFYTSVAS